jgi:uncharacterized protein YwgA
MRFRSPDNEFKNKLPSILISLASDDQIDGITRFQKLVFILQEGDLIEFDGLNQANRYDYEAHNYGPYSKELHNQLDRLDRKGVINKEAKRTPAGNKKEVFELGPEAPKATDAIEELDIDSDRLLRTIKEYEDMPLLELLDVVYEEYPDYAAESKL